LSRGEFGLAETKTLLNVTQEKLPASQVGLKIEVPTDLSQKIYDQVVNDFVRNADIPGFRRGKVPRQVVLQRIGSARLKAAAVESIVQKTLDQAIQQEKIQVLGNFQLQTDFEELIIQYQPGAVFSFSAAVDVPPEATLGTYKGFKIKAVQVDYDPAKVDQVLLEQQTQRATLIPVEDRPAQASDTVLIDFKGRIAEGSETNAEAEAIVGGDATDFQLDLVPGQFIPGFAEGVIGMQVGETKEVPVTFPAEYFQEDLAGKDAIFTITLNEIKEKELPSLDDEFATEISEFETLTELRELLEKRYREEAEQQTKINIEAAILDELLLVADAQLPEVMVREEINAILTQSLMRLQSQGLDVNKLLSDDLIERMREQARPDAVQRLLRSLALAEVAKQENIEVSAEEVEQRYLAALEQMGNRKIDRSKLRDVVEGELIETKTLAWLREQSEVTFITAEEAEALQKAKAEKAVAAVTEAAEAVAPPPGETEAKPKSEKAKKGEPAPEPAAEPVREVTVAPEAKSAEAGVEVEVKEAPAEPKSRKTTAKKAAEPKEDNLETQAATKSEAVPAKKTTTRKTTSKKTPAADAETDA
jgi:trigger factor